MPIDFKQFEGEEREKETSLSLEEADDIDGIFQDMGISTEAGSESDEDEEFERVDWIFAQQDCLSVVFKAPKVFTLLIHDSEGDLDFWEGLRFESVEDINAVTRLFVGKVVESLGIPFEIKERVKGNGVVVIDLYSTHAYEVGDGRTFIPRMRSVFETYQNVIKDMTATRATWLANCKGEVQTTATVDEKNIS